MKAKLCDKCGKLLPQEGCCQIPVLWKAEGTAGFGKVEFWLVRDTCKSCAFGTNDLVNGDEEVKYAKKYATNIDWNAIGRLYDQGKTVKEIVMELGYSATTVRRGITKKKAASQKE